MPPMPGPPCWQPAIRKVAKRNAAIFLTMPIGLPNTRYSHDPLADTRTDSMPGSHWQYVTYVCFRSDVKIRETETDCKPILDKPMAMTESDVQAQIGRAHV